MKLLSGATIIILCLGASTARDAILFPIEVEEVRLPQAEEYTSVIKGGKAPSPATTRNKSDLKTNEKVVQNPMFEAFGKITSRRDAFSDTD